MTPQKSHRGIGAPAAPRQRAAGMAVHVFTASGALIGFLALMAAIDGRYAIMFAWLALALFVDGIDGTFARRVDIKRTAPAISGDVLDLVVDYVTYVLVPVLALVRADLLPHWAELPAAALILVTSALYFADVRMKTDDWYFRGFPAVWNVIGFYIFAIQPWPWLALAAVIAFSALTFAPVRFVHPMRVAYMRMPTFAMLGIGSLLFVLTLVEDFATPLWAKLLLLVVAAYFFGVGLLRPPRQRV